MPPTSDTIDVITGVGRLRLTTHRRSYMENADRSPKQLSESLSAAQLEKLSIEIEKLKLETEGLRNKTSRRINLSAYTPIVSVLIAVGGFLFGVLQYYNQQQKAQINEQTDQRLKVQAQIRDNLNQILQFPNEKGRTLSQVAFLLNDLDQSLKIKIGGVENTPQKLQEEQRKITSNLIQMLLNDCNFDEPREAEVGRVVFDNWDDCKAYLKTDSDSLDDILIKYTDAMARLRDLAPSYITRVLYSDDRTQFNEPAGASEADKSHLRHFETLVIGFSNYLKLAADNQQFQADAVKEFQASTCNETFTKQEFGMSFDPKSDPAMFVDCPAKPKKK
jgi:hypothetical protein